MALNDTMNQLHHLLVTVTKDLEKVHKGNRAAAQRVRVGTIKLEKVAKQFRKESVSAEKTGKLKRKPAGKGKATKQAPAKTAAKKGAVKKGAVKKPMKKKKR